MIMHIPKGIRTNGSVYALFYLEDISVMDATRR